MAAEHMQWLSALQNTTALSEQAFRIFRRLRAANEGQIYLISVFTHHEIELQSIKHLVGIVEDETELHVDSVANELVRLVGALTKLRDLLIGLDPRRNSKKNEFARQFVQGSADEKQLATIMNELAHVKAMLLKPNIEVIERIDKFLRETIPDCKGLGIARLLEGRHPSVDGTVLLTKQDRLLLNEKDSGDWESETAAGESQSTSSDTQDHAQTDESVQFNAVADADPWKGLGRISIRKNLAESQAVTINHGQSLDIMDFFRSWQKENTANARQSRFESLVKSPSHTTYQNPRITIKTQQDAWTLLAFWIATDPDLDVLCSEMVDKLGKAKFVAHGHELLEEFYLGVLGETKTELQEKTINLLKSRRGRIEIIAEVVNTVSSAAWQFFKQKLNVAEQRYTGEQRLKRWMQTVKDVPKDDSWRYVHQTSKVENGHPSEAGNEETLSEGEIDWDSAPDIDEMLAFLRNSPSFQSLTTGLKSLLLPQNLKEIVTAYHFEVRDDDTQSFSNNFKTLVEDYTMLDWNWWPLERRMKPLEPDQSRLIWHCSCGTRLWMETSKHEAALARSMVDLPKKSFSVLPQCHQKLEPLPAWWWRLAENIWYSVSQLGISRQTRAHTNEPILAPSAATPSAVVIGQATSSTGPSSVQGTSLSKPPSSPTQSVVLSPNTLLQSSISTAGSVLPPRWILFGVQGSRRPIELEHIKIDDYDNDSGFYRSLREHYRKHRGIWKLLFSIWRLDFCDGVKFDCLASNFILDNEVDLPTDFDEYQYYPTPPDAKNPLINRHYAEMFLNCDSPCQWRLFHKCAPELVCRTMVERVPRKRTKFDIVNINSHESQAWGLKPRHSPSAAYVAFYHLLILVLQFTFWGWWQAAHPDDLQNASVPVTVVLGMLSLFWGTNGILSQGRHLGERSA